MKKIISILLAISIICGFTVSVAAVSGEGTELNPYMISTPAELMAISDDLSAHYKLANNIDMSGVYDYKPIGNAYDGAFTGSLDGNGFTISNLNIELPGEKYTGLFGYSEGDISNLILSNVYIIGGRYVGGIAGYSGVNGSINNCSVEGYLTSKDALIDINVGGISGCYTGKMFQCHASGQAYVNDDKLSVNIGGVIGIAYDTAEIYSCTNRINISFIRNSHNFRAGGIVGYSNNHILIDGCINYSEINNISNYSVYSGGILGLLEYGKSKISNCLNKGNCGAGIVGFCYKGEITVNSCTNYAKCSGGILEESDDSTVNIIYCKNYGECYVGIIRYISNSKATVISCSNSGKCSKSGIVGSAGGSTTVIIEKCSNHGPIHNDNQAIAGILCLGSGYMGSQYVTAYVYDCYNTASINTTSSSNYCYGIAKKPYYDSRLTVKNCYNIGKILSGYTITDGSDSNNVYALNSSIGGGNKIYLSDEQMKDQTTYKNWDFENTWYIDPNVNNGYPMLRCFEKEQYAMNISCSSIKTGDTITLTPYLNGEPIEAVCWTSSDVSVAEVSVNGIVTANNAGVTTITATTADGHKINSCVSVIKPCGGIIIADKTVNKNSYITATATLNDSLSNEMITDWQSSDTSIATVSTSGALSADIKGVNIGTCEITATSILGETATFTVTVTSNATSISLSSTSTVNRGKTKTLKPTVTPSPTQSALTWSSSDESIATVDQNGVVTGVSCGKSVITVQTDNGYSATCTVTVKAPVETLTMERASITVTKGFTDKVVVLPDPLDTTDTITYSTSSSTYVSVNSSTGVITGNKAGTATITATASSGAKAYCTVTVVNAETPVTGITLDRDEINIHAGELLTLKPNVLPSSATNQQLTWSVADSSIATVTQTGVVKGIAEGSTVVTAKTVDGGYSVSCTVNVIIDVVAIKLDKDHLDMNSNEKASLIATIMPDNASNKNVIWSSSEESIAKVDQNGVVTAVSQGVAVITAKTQDWNKIATCFVTVTEPVDTVRISSTSASVVLDKSITLTASVLPENATYPEISWSSSDNSVASVDENGVVTAHKLGIATITATAHNGKYTKCEIYVVSFEGAEYTDFVCEKTADGTGVIIKEYCGTSSDVIIPRAIGNLPVTTLGNALFVNCEQTIETLTIPETVTTIDVNSFGSSVGLVRCYEYSAAHEYAAANNLNYELIYEMTLSAQSATLYRGDEKQLSVAITPSAMANSAISWSSSNNSVATVSDNGLIVANMQGTAIITATDEFGNDVTCRVRVIPRTPTIYIYNFDRSYEWKLDWWKPYSSAKMKLTYYSYNCEDAVRFEWSSSNKRVKIDSAGNITNTGFFGRSSIITIKAYDAQGNVIASSDVKVMFYKFKWQKDRLQTQAIVSDNYLDRDVPEQTLDKTVENETVAVFSYFIEYMERIFKFLIF